MPLLAKRIYKGELIVVGVSTLTVAGARKKLAEIAAFPNVLTGDSEGEGDGELWFEIEDDKGNLIDDPVCFAAEHALAAYVRTGMAEDEAKRLLSDEYAERSLHTAPGLDPEEIAKTIEVPLAE